MIVRNIPTWAVWLMNVAVVAIITGIAYLAKWIGPEFCFGWIGGFAFCYIAFQNWKKDYDEPTEPEAPPRQQPRSRSIDRTAGR
jgi:hypothetical protein